jgi:hypothetical protein
MEETQLLPFNKSCSFSAISMVENSSLGLRTKHVETRHLSMCELVELNCFLTECKHTEFQPTGNHMCEKMIQMIDCLG